MKNNLSNESQGNTYKIPRSLKPKVSIIIPVYNVEKYLEDCIKSISDQTLDDIEIICVNDGSKDSSLEILNKLAENDGRIIVIDQKNAGAGAARNTGIARATGKYLGFVDSDDLIYPTMYEEMYEKAEKTQADMVITGEIETFFDNNIVFPDIGSTHTVDEMTLGSFKAIEYPEILKNIFLWNRIFLRSFWQENDFEIPVGRKFAEDMLICTQASVLAKKIGYVKGPLYKYRNVREDSLSFTLAKSQNKLDFLVATKETRDFLKSTEQYEFFAMQYLQFCTHMFVMLQAKMPNYKCYKTFFEGYAELLDEDDIAMIKQSWLFGAYNNVLEHLETGDSKAAYKKRKIN